MISLPIEYWQYTYISTYTHTSVRTHISLCMFHSGNMSTQVLKRIFLGNRSWALVVNTAPWQYARYHGNKPYTISELLQNLEELFPRCYIHSDSLYLCQALIHTVVCYPSLKGYIYCFCDCMYVYISYTNYWTYFTPLHNASSTYQ